MKMPKKYLCFVAVSVFLTALLFIFFQVKSFFTSIRFTYEIEENKIIFTTVGNGHGVGMCQYGAKGMAEMKKSFQQILNYLSSFNFLKRNSFQKVEL